MSETRQNQAEVFVKDLKRIADQKPIGIALCEALGLDPSTTQIISVVLDAPDAPVSVRCLVSISPDKSHGLGFALRQYKLVPLDDGLDDGEPN